MLTMVGCPQAWRHWKGQNQRLIMLTPTHLTTNHSEECPGADHACCFNTVRPLSTHSRVGQSYVYQLALASFAGQSNREPFSPRSPKIVSLRFNSALVHRGQLFSSTWCKRIFRESGRQAPRVNSAFVSIDCLIKLLPQAPQSQTYRNNGLP